MEKRKPSLQQKEADRRVSEADFLLKYYAKLTHIYSNDPKYPPNDIDDILEEIDNK